MINSSATNQSSTPSTPPPPSDRPHLSHALSSSSSVTDSVTSIPLSITPSTPATSAGLQDRLWELPNLMGLNGSTDQLGSVPASLSPHLLKLLTTLEQNPDQFTAAATGGGTADDDFIAASLSRLGARLSGSSGSVVKAADSRSELDQLRREYEVKLEQQEDRHKQEMHKSQIHHDEEVR